ncbi:non-ribosomal peptide synthetase [Xanthomonas arboricola]|uniref:non-ribosomal peptide synthetase n=1 Tax=Xanthomonas arboricola TaxID=56448 RepID=UPI00208E8123|nr:non-ribosomal peptide synthetase [Xanthomonas arboricola]
MDKQITQLTAAQKAQLLKLAKAARLRPAAASQDTLQERIEHQPTTGPQPASLAQQRLWFLDQLEHASTIAYQLMGSLALRDPVDPAALHRAVHALRDRHESLRTVFGTLDGQAVATVLAPADVDIALPVDDLRALAPAERQAALARITAQEVDAHFDLAQGPLLRVRLLLLGPDTHTLLFKLHHIVADGWSLLLFARELETLYAAFCQGAEPSLPPLPIQYADYARWQQRWLQSPQRDALAQAWAQRLVAAPALLQLPLDRTRPAARSYRGAGQDLVLDPALTQRLKALAAAHGMTLFMLLYSAFAVLLSRLSGQATVVIGTPMANRQRTELESVIGLFANALPLPLQVDERSNVHALLQQARQMILDAYAHQEIPFDRIVETLQPARNLNHHPVFQAMIALQNMPRSQTQDAATGLVPQNGAQFDLSLGLVEWGDRILGTLNYASDLFDADTIARWAAAYAHVLRQIVEDPQRPLATLSLLDAASRRQVVQDFNATDRACADGLVHTLFEAQVARTPDAIAAVDANEQVSYAALDRRANRLARHLRACGVGPEHRVAVSVERGVPLLLALLATLKAGGAYVPLDPDAPPQRLAEMLHDSRPTVVLQTQRTPVPAQLVGAAQQVWLDQPHTWAQLSGAALAVPGLTNAQLAYVIYTSGSTGRPKGVMNAHRGVVNRLRWMQDAYALQPGQSVLQKTPCSFDVSVWEFFWPLLAGARLVFARPGGHRDPGYLHALIEREGIDTLHFVPSMLDAFVEAVDASSTCASLTQVFCSGETLPRELAQRFAARWPQVGLHNLYGPTEAAVDVTAYACAHLPPAGEVPIGAPIANVRIYVLDTHGAPVPIGVPGELYIGGIAVARGYEARAGLTAERFVVDAHGPTPGARLYRTGDLGRWRADGTLDYLGRNDSQVKLRGHRIELGEIEARLRDWPQVREAAVVLHGAGTRARLVGYVTGIAAQPPDLDALRQHLRAHLPTPMLPAALVLLSAMPLTPNGKLDRKALPAPDADPLPLQTYVPPRGEREQALALIWQDLLQLPHVGRHDHFFELGGHSLLAIQLVARVRLVLGQELALRTVFACPTLAELSDALATADSVPAEKIEHQPTTGPQPASLAQQRLWFLDQLEHASTIAYQLMGSLALRDPVDPAALHRAMHALRDRHESLRTVFGTLDGQAVATVLAPADVDIALPVDDLRALAPAERQAALARITAQEVDAHFDLAQGPLLRVRLLLLGPDTHTLLFKLHHIVADGWSLLLFARELETLYAAFCQGAEPSLPPLPIQYADYARWQQRWLQSPQRDALAQAWAQRLVAAPALLQLPLDRTRPAARSYRGAGHDLVLDPALTQRLKALAAAHGMTLFMLLYSAFAVLLSRLSGQATVVIGTPMANRQRTELESVIGLFANALPLPLQVDERSNVHALLQQARQMILDAYAHQEIPFDRIVETLQPARNLNHHPVFQAMIALQNMPRSQTQDAATGLVPQNGAQFDLSLGLVEWGDRILGTLNYASDLFDADTIARWAAAYAHVLRQIVEDPQRPLATLSLLDAASRRQVVQDFNATDRACADGLVHTLFEAQVARTPDAIAAVDANEQVSYAALDRRANRLARHLRACGVGPEHRVAVSVERGVPLLLALLATLKAGGAYVPLDPDAPPQRLAEMLHDSRPTVVLQTQRTPVPAQLVGAAQQVWLDQPHTWAQLSGAALAVPGLTNAQLAYVIYTSGSTGRPKGVMNAHRGVVNRLRWMQDAYALQPGQSVLQKTPCSFDVSVWEFFWPLLAGARLVFARPGGHRDPGYLHALIEREGIDTLHFVPSMLDAFVEAVDASSTCASLTQVFCSGETLPRELAQRFAARWPQVGLHNLYGPTEAAVDVTAYACAHLPPAGEVPIGAPIANVRIYVLDTHGAPVPIGVPGELYIGGIAVARGYEARAGLTAERFVVDTHGPTPGARLYRTGDLGRWRADGTLDYLGRNDSQVKLRGHRIELGEIEACLRDWPQVREAAVVLHGTGAHARLVGYVTGAGAQSPDLDALRQHLRAHLPTPMLPAALVLLPAMPLTPNGKLDRKALPAPDADALPLQTYVPPRGEREQALALIWQDLLQLPHVGRHDHFFELGGHSLLAVQLVARVRLVLGQELALRTVFACPTLAELSDALASTAATAQVQIPVADRSRPLPLSPIQQQLWRWERTRTNHEHPALYCTALRLHGTLDRKACTAALDAIVARHEILRTWLDLDVDPDEPRQRISAQARFPLSQFDLAHLPQAQREQRVFDLYRQFGSEPFDVSAGPLLRACLIRLDPSTHVLILALHRLICDAWSLEVLIRETSALYNAFKAGENPSLPPLPIQFADYVAWFHDWMQGENLRKHVEYYTHHLAGAPVALALPADTPVGPVDSHRAAAVHLVCGRALSNGLLRLVKDSGVTPSMAILAGYALLLMRLSGQDDVIIGTIVGNRPRMELESLIGPFAQAIAMRFRVDADMTVSGFLHAVREVAVASQSYQSLSAEKIFDAMNLRHRPIGALFRFQNEPRSPLSLDGLSVQPQPDGPEGRPDLLHVDVSLVVDQQPGQILANLHYASDKFEHATAQAWLDRLRSIYAGMAEQPDRRIADWDF